jgi:hypothetical protein
MIRLSLALALMLAADPALACRLHSIWHYPWPQRCAAHPVALAPAPVEDRWYVEITRMPDDVGEDRAIGVEALKRALGGSQ